MLEQQNYIVKTSTGELKDLRQITFEIEDSLAKYREKMRLTRNEIIRLNALDLNASIPAKQSQVKQISIPEQDIENESLSKIGVNKTTFVTVETKAQKKKFL